MYKLVYSLSDWVCCCDFSSYFNELTKKTLQFDFKPLFFLPLGGLATTKHCPLKAGKANVLAKPYLLQWNHGEQKICGRNVFAGCVLLKIDNLAFFNSPCWSVTVLAILPQNLCSIVGLLCSYTEEVHISCSLQSSYRLYAVKSKLSFRIH